MFVVRESPCRCLPPIRAGFFALLVVLLAGPGAVFAQEKEKEAEAPAPKSSGSISTILRAVIGIHSKVPPKAQTAQTLGTERDGSGVVIDATGLILTVGYLVLEANEIVVTRPGGKKVPARFVGYDNGSGLALIKATQPLNLKSVKLGDSKELKPGARVMIVSHAGMPPVSAAQVVSRRPYAGYWEYLQAEAIFTSPPHMQYSGAALFGEDGKIHGIGSVFVNDAISPGVQLPGNMFIPVGTLKPVMVDLLERGRPAGPARPWIGIHTNVLKNRVVVIRVRPNGPADTAGIRTGDVIVGVGGKSVKTAAELYREIWKQGDAGAEIPLDVLTEKQTDLKVRRVNVRSESRYDWLDLSNAKNKKKP